MLASPRALALACPLALALLPACGIFGGWDDDGTAGDDLPPGWFTETASTSAGSVDSGYDTFDTYATSEVNDSSIEPTGADDDPEAGCPCAPGTELIYVLSDSGTLWSFDPQDLHFARIADIKCGGMKSTFSMGVSRKARAWVQYQSGDLYTVDLNDPSDPIPCLDPGFENQNPKFPNFGMAFVANSVVDPCDKLHAHSAIAPDVIGEGVGALGVIDPQTLELSEIAPIDYGWGELTGTSTGRLFAYQGSAPPLLSEYDKGSGELLDVLPLPQLSSDSAFAFAWWGGDFYLFHDPNLFGSYSEVWHLDYDESDGMGQAMTKIISQAPIRVVGAGVSTCVPAGPV
ncbi:MAG: hypothetical protein H6710_02095 [Myxococcales bacterium]|nr:hypothetical protein [Myxococcales bacterium]